MKNSNYFNCEESNKLWEQYFNEVDKYLTKIPYEQGSIIRKELESHAYEAAQADTSKIELESLENSLSNLGNPKDIVPPMVANALIRVAQKSNNPLDVIRALVFRIGSGIVNTISSLVIAVLTLFSGTLFIVALAKPFAPENVGLFTDETTGFSFGIIMGTQNMEEHLGYNIIPVCVILAFGFYKSARYMLKYLK